MLVELEDELDALLYEQAALREWNNEALADVAETADRVNSAITEQRRIETELKRRQGRRGTEAARGRGTGAAGCVRAPPGSPPTTTSTSAS